MQQYAARHLADDPDKAAFGARLAQCAEGGGLPAATHDALAQWQALAQWLLLKGNAQFRRQLDKNAGFPAKGTGPGAAARGERNDAMRTLLADLEALPDFASTLDAARHLPPARYADGTWALIDALAELLPRVAAHLHIAFADAGTIDFVEAQIAARDALGSAEAPSDLLLRLDFTIDHLLIDEFQDTSFAQLELIELLTAGWEPSDGRTLFAVGDPMQSIYRFREAEVRLFVEAQQRRMIGNVPVEPIVLSRNFRSHDGLVQWVNATFAGVLGAINDPWRGVVAFAPAIANEPAQEGPAVTFDALQGRAAEAQAVVRRVEMALSTEKATVAILVRARSHLADILPALRSAGIAYSAVDLDALAERPAILDLLALTHAVAQPADRLAYLSALRAPWCGLRLSDLLVLTGGADATPAHSMAALPLDAAALRDLSPDGRKRFHRVRSILDAAMDARGRATLSSRVRGAWLALAGPATLDDAIDLDAAERFFATLSEHEIAGDVPDWSGFVAALALLRAVPQAQEAARVQVMTLHRAKGLEFDVVIMPGLARTPNRQDTPLIRWRRRPQGLLLAPLKERGGEADPVYAYLSHLAEGEEAAELGRVLYVGCTRARSRLHLVAELAVKEADDGTLEWKTPRGGSALARFGASLDPMRVAPERTAAEIVAATRPPGLARIPAAWSAPPPVASVPARAQVEDARELLPFDWVRETARQVGIVAHRLFAQIGREGIAAWSEERVASLGPRIRSELAEAGVDASELAAASAQVEAAVNGIIADARGRWFFAPEHGDARSEWALGGTVDGTTVHVVLDRTFVADEVRYIVDFKTGVHEGADLSAFLDGEVLRYRDQLARYAAIVAALDPRPIRLALYYPLLREWREWPAA